MDQEKAERDLCSRVAAYIGIPVEEARRIAARAPGSYRRYSKPKKNGQTRWIFHPSKETKSLQYALMDLFLSKFEVHNSAIGYRAGVASPIRRNAELHTRYEYTVSLDLQDFFPSIKPRDLLHAFERSQFKGTLGTDEIDFLCSCLFVKFRAESFAPIGAPSSPMLSNLVMSEFDAQMDALARQLPGGGVYTRYADDLNYSSQKKGACKDFEKKAAEIVSHNQYPHLKLNTSKTKYASRGTSRHVLGLVLTPDQGISIGRSEKRRVRSLVQQLRDDKLDPNEKPRLRGYLAYVKDVEPDFINRLMIKYGSPVFEKLRSEPGAQ